MSLVVETGSGSATAESYASVAQFKTYFGNRGIDVSALSDTQIEQNLRISTDYMVGYYRSQWKGYRNSLTQALDWPRYDVVLDDLPASYGQPYLVPNNIIPQEVINACMILAYKSSQNGGILADDIEPQVKMEKVDVISTTYTDNALPYVLYRSVDLALDPYLEGSDGTAKLVRA